MQNECAPREFAYELSEVSAGTRVELVNGEVRFTNKLGQGVKIEAPWLIEASGKSRADAVHWELDASKVGSGPATVAPGSGAGLRYPVVIDPSWTATGSIGTARQLTRRRCCHQARCWWREGKVISVTLSSAELYDPATGTLDGDRRP